MLRDSVLEILSPASGETALELGPGTGCYSLPVARALAPAGQLTALDLQAPMLEELMRRAETASISNIDLIAGDAQALLFPGESFDAAFLVAALGEIPHKQRAPRELRRLLKPGGRLVAGEGQPDPHQMRPDGLRAWADGAGPRFPRVAAAASATWPGL